MTAIASRNPFDLLSEDGEPRSSPMTAVKTKGAASTAAPAVNISSKSNTSAAAAQFKPKGENTRNNSSNNNNNNNNNNNRSGNNASRDNNQHKGERKPYVQRAPGPATGEGAIYEKFPKGSQKKDGAGSGQAARGPRAGRGGRANNDRHSNNGRRDTERRHGGGQANWGNEEQDMHKLEHLDANNASEALKEYAEGENAGLDANGEATTPAEKAQEEEEEPQLTLEEYKAQLAAKRSNAAQRAARAANQGEEIKGVLTNQRRDEEDFFVGKKATEASKKEKKETKAKQYVDIEQKFNEASRPPRGEGMDRRNSRGGRGGNRGGSSFGGRGGSRGGNAGGRGGRGGHNKSNSGSAAPGADLTDLSSFPSLQR